MAETLGDAGANVAVQGDGIENWELRIENWRGHRPRMTTMKRFFPIALFALCALGARASLPFIENDYRKAAAEAKAKNVPLFVEAWAPW